MGCNQGFGMRLCENILDPVYNTGHYSSTQARLYSDLQYQRKSRKLNSSCLRYYASRIWWCRLTVSAPREAEAGELSVKGQPGQLTFEIKKSKESLGYSWVVECLPSMCHSGRGQVLNTEKYYLESYNLWKSGLILPLGFTPSEQR